MISKQRIPLLKDHHNHLSFYALLLDCLNLQHVRDKSDAMHFLRQLDRNRVSLVLGWNSSYYDFSSEDLVGLGAVIIVNVSLHKFLMTPEAERRLSAQYGEITTNYRDPVWFEKNMPRLLIFLPEQVEPTPEKYEVFFEYMLQRGVYYVEEMHLPSDRIFHALRPYVHRAGFWTDPLTYKGLGADAAAAVTGIKLFTDGALGACSAAMSRPFADGRNGDLLYSNRELFAVMRDISVSGKGTAVHAIGDRATAQVVSIAAQLKAEGFGFPILRMEHCQFISPESAATARELGMVLSMQPNFNTDSTVYADRLDQGFLESNNPFRMLIDQVGFSMGENLILGSDGMPHGIEGALVPALVPPFDGQRLTMDEFTRGYCMPDLSHGFIDVEMNAGGQFGFSVNC